MIDDDNCNFVYSVAFMFYAMIKRKFFHIVKKMVFFSFINWGWGHANIVLSSSFFISQKKRCCKFCSLKWFFEQLAKEKQRKSTVKSGLVFRPNHRSISLGGKMSGPISREILLLFLWDLILKNITFKPHIRTPGRRPSICLRTAEYIDTTNFFFAVFFTFLVFCGKHTTGKVTNAMMLMLIWSLILQ